MADRTLDARNGRKEEAAPAEETPAAAPAPPSLASNPWLPLIVTAILMPALAFATTRYFLLPQMKKALYKPMAAAAAQAEPTGTNGAGGGGMEGAVKQTVPMQKILVNVAGTMGTRYLMTSITLVGTDPNLKDKIDQNQDQLRDLATGTLCTKTISDLEKPGARNVIRAELLEVFNNALGGPLIKEIYITELAVQ
jgi:flagellar FliL protein